MNTASRRLVGLVLGILLVAAVIHRVRSSTFRSRATKAIRYGENLHAEQIVFKSSRSSGKVLTLNSKESIQRFQNMLAGAKLVNTEDYTQNTLAKPGKSFQINIKTRSATLKGFFYVGAHRQEGIGFLFERIEDDHWFYGAWDPWPALQAYWIPMGPSQWVNTPDSVQPATWLTEAFYYLFLVPENKIPGIQCVVDDSQWSYSLKGASSAANCEFLEVGSAQKFLNRYPEVFDIWQKRIVVPEQK